MLAVLTTHPIQYQVPLWQALAEDGSIPFEVWYLSEHGVKESLDPEFGKSFAWDLDMLSGYPHRLLDVAPGAKPGRFWSFRLRERLGLRLRSSGVRWLWLQGWQVGAYWQAIHAAKSNRVAVWMRGESNDLRPSPLWKRPLKRAQMAWLVRSVNEFLFIGSANRRLYSKFGVPATRLRSAPYAVDNARFASQAEAIRMHRLELRRGWAIPDDALCVLFCGKLLRKKRPADLIAAAETLLRGQRPSKVHLLFVGSGELGPELRRLCEVAFDQEAGGYVSPSGISSRPLASFAGFLNQAEISKAYVAADCLVLPSDFGETWGLVVNEALASGLPCAVSRACGCAEDLARTACCRSFELGDVGALAEILEGFRLRPPGASERAHCFAELPSYLETIETVKALACSAQRSVT